MMHQHKCQCGTVFCHDLDYDKMIEMTHAQVDASHDCPSCGTEVLRIYNEFDSDDDIPKFCSNGVRCIPLDEPAARELRSSCAKVYKEKARSVCFGNLLKAIFS